MLRALIGIYHDEVALGISQFDREALELELGTTKFQLVICRNRRVYLYKEDGDDAGFSFVNAGESQQPGHEVRINCRRDDSVETARCQNHWITMLPGEFLGQAAYYYDLPLDHQLPWPRPRECDSYWVPDEVMKEVVRRRQSAIKAGHPIPVAPAHLTMRLTAQQRTNLWRADQELKHMKSTERRTA